LHGAVEEIDGWTRNKHTRQAADNASDKAAAIGALNVFVAIPY
jgi:hypothetical protein